MHEIYYSLNSKFFLGIEKRLVFDQVLLVLKKKMDTNDPEMCINLW